MSTATYLTAALILPGQYMEDGRPPGVPEDQIWEENKSGGFGFIDNEARAGIIYSVEQKKNITLEDIKVNEKGLLSEEILIIQSFTGIEPECSGDSLSNTNWMDDYAEMMFEEANMEGVYEIVKRNYDYSNQRGQKFHEDWRRNPAIGPVKNWDSDDKMFFCSFAALWGTKYSQGYEDLYPELDYIEFLGEGRVELVNTNL
jgi:hypothetical protein